MRNPMNMLKRAVKHLRDERGSGDCKDAIARNQALATLHEAMRQVIVHHFDYQHEELVARGQVQPIAEEV